MPPKIQIYPHLLLFDCPPFLPPLSATYLLSSCNEKLISKSRFELFVLSQVMVVIFLLAIIFLPRPCSSSIQSFEIKPGFQGPQMNFIDNDGLFLLSNDSTFAFGFVGYSPQDTTHFVLAVVHQATTTVVWTANRGGPVTQSDNFVFGKDGNAYLQSNGAAAVWSTNSSNKGAAVMRLLNTGNLVMLGGENSSSDPIWQSFSHPTDTLLSNQSFVEGMKLVSKPNGNNLSYSLEIRGGDMMLLAGFQPPQPYWSMQQEKRKIDNKLGGQIYSAVLDSNSWNFYDQKQSLLSQFIVQADSSGPGVIWTAVLGDDGFLSFFGLQNGDSKVASSIRAPQDTCDAPETCGPYYVCGGDGRCLCPGVLSSYSGCDPGVSASSCSSGGDRFQLAKVDDGIGYFATHFTSPSAKTNLTGCQAACLANCSCVALFYEDSSRSCFLFDQIGSLRQLDSNSTAYSSYIKMSGRGGNGQSPGQEGSGSSKHLVVVLVICLATAGVIAALIYVAIRVRRRQKRLPAEPSQMGSSEEDNFLDAISGMPVRFTYRELQDATNNFRVKLGQGGFGSVYLGKLPNGAQIAVKKLEGIGQGKKEFRAEVSTIGSIHHVHLVRLKGFCAEGTHRLLAYEYMSNGSLERWIFKNGNEGSQLSWEQRCHIALGTAKGLAYLHEDCDSKIVHCDIKPENVLLDDNFVAKVSDFGLAKLMTREQSHVFTTLRGTRGYLAPEWITNYAISEKSDVYSFGMVLLELVGGRKNFDPSETSEKAHFPTYAFKKMEEGKLMEILDGKLKCDDKDGSMETTIKVALWCIQEDLSLRPSMSKVVQMLEGLCHVPQPPTSSQFGFRMYANLFKSLSEEGSSSGPSSSGPSDCNSDTFLSAVRLSGPR